MLIVFSITGISSALNLQNGNFGFAHPLASSGLLFESSVGLINDQWYHLHKQIDQENGVAKLLSMDQKQYLEFLIHPNPLSLISSPIGWLELEPFQVFWMKFEFPVEFAPMIG